MLTQRPNVSAPSLLLLAALLATSWTPARAQSWQEDPFAAGEKGFGDSGEDKQPDPAEGFLLRVHEVVNYPDGNGDVLAFVFRDGLTVLFNMTPSGKLTVFRAHARPTDLAELNHELSRLQIGTQKADCDLPWTLAPEFDLPAGATGRSGVLSWFGNRNRSNHLRFGYSEVADNFGSVCGDDLTSLSLHISSLIQRPLDPPVTPPQLHRADDEVLYVVQNSFQEDPDCGDDGFIDDYFVFRDGLVLRNAQAYSGGYGMLRGQATENALQEFNAALAVNRVGFQGGECKVWFFQPFTIGGGCGDYTWQSGATWYGAKNRRSTLHGSEASVRRCTFEQHEVAGAVTQFLRNTGAQDRTHHVTGYLPATP